MIDREIYGITSEKPDSSLSGAPIGSTLQPPESSKVMNTKVLLVALILAFPAIAQPVGASAAPVVAQGEHDHNGFHMHGGGGHGRGGNNAYGKAKIEERDRLLGKLKSICKGC
jgi:hypothetical protein